MKYSILVLAFLFVSGFQLDAQENENIDYRYNVLKINPTVFGRAEFNLSYERYFNNRKSSLTLSPSVYLKENLSQTINGWQIAAQYRFYLTHFNKQNRKVFLGMENFGFYSAVYALSQDYYEEFQNGYWDPMTSEYSMKKFEKDVKAYEGGALIGLQIDITKRIVLDFNVGGGVRFTDYYNTYEEFAQDNLQDYSVFDPEYQGVKPKLELLLGITF